MKCARHTQQKRVPNDFSLSELTFVEPKFGKGMVDGTTIKRRIALCKECYQAYKAYVDGKSG